MKVGPSQRIIANDAQKARPLRASDTMSGLSSPWKALARMATQAAVMVMRLSLSARDSDGVVMVGC
jgi:hypothetical protein